MKDYKIWKFIVDHLKSEKSLVLLIVPSHQGSSPGKQGFKMVVTKDAVQVGSIGGGIMEVNLVNRSVQKLSKEDYSIEMLVQKHNNKGPKDEQSGLLCSGSQNVIIVPLLSKVNLLDIEKIIQHYGNPEYLKLSISSSEIAIEKYTKNKVKYQFIAGENWKYVEIVGRPNVVHIFGGGHVGNSISRVLSVLDFYIIVNDNRKNLEMLQKNQFPQEKRIGNYHELANQVIGGPETYVIVVTFQMKDDVTVLENLLGKDFKYVGLMGSKTKIRNIFTRLKQLGFSNKVLEEIHTPIGIPINDETAEEIAISIVAQLIKLKNG